MHFMSKENNSSKIFDKFDGFHNTINVIKTKFVNEIKQSLFYLNQNIIKKKIYLKIK